MSQGRIHLQRQPRQAASVAWRLRAAEQLFSCMRATAKLFIFVFFPFRAAEKPCSFLLRVRVRIAN